LFGDHARVHYEDRQLLRHLDQEAAEAARAEIRAQRGLMAETIYQIRENRNMVVGVSWLSCMAGSLLYTFSQKGLTTTQRIVTARKSIPETVDDIHGIRFCDLSKDPIEIH